MWKRIGAIVASLIVSALFLWIALRDVPVDLVFGSILEANPLWVMVSLAIGILGIYTRGIRWRGLIDNQVTTTRAFYIMGITFLLNLLPMRLGEVARAVLASREKVPFMMAATSIVVERLLDTVLVLILIGICIGQVETLPERVTQVAPVFAGLAVVAFVVMMVLARYPNFARRVLHAITSRVPLLEKLPLEELLDHTLAGLKPLINPAHFTHAVVWTLISWVTSFASFYTAQIALGISATELIFPTLSLSLAAFSVALPLTVAAIGPFELAVELAGEATGIDNILSTAMGLLIHAVAIVMYAITGVWGLLGMGIAITDVVSMKEKPKMDNTHP